jgi:hypothetical protein
MSVSRKVTVCPLRGSKVGSLSPAPRRYLAASAQTPSQSAGGGSDS